MTCLSPKASPPNTITLKPGFNILILGKHKQQNHSTQLHDLFPSDQKIMVQSPHLLETKKIYYFPGYGRGHLIFTLDVTTAVNCTVSP